MIVHAVVVYREVLLLRPPLRKSLHPVLWEEQLAERVWPREASAKKAKVGLRAPGSAEKAEVELRAPRGAIGCTKDGCVCFCDRLS